jgi:PAS domain S-box-containing protein
MDQAGQGGKLRALFWRFTRGTILLGIGASIGFGVMSGSQSTESNYNPHLFAIGIAGLLALACTYMAYLFFRNRMLRGSIRRLEEENETLSDRHWEMNDAQERARELIDAQGDMIVRRDSAGRIVYANDAYCRLAGQPRADLIGTAQPLDLIEQGAVVTTTDGTRIHDQKIRTASGERWIGWRDVTLRGDEGGEIQSVGRDITDRVHAEAALADARDRSEEANRAKSRFLAMVSHEIRTPLNGILGMSELLLDTQLTPEQVTYTKAVRTSGETLLSLIEEILDFSKIEAGRLDLEARPFRLASLIEDTVELLAPRAQAKGLDIAAYVDDRLPQRVVGDVTRLRQVLLNLAGNALKFTEKGGFALLVEPAIWPGEVSFKVRDTGIGISADDQTRIFGEFEQGDASATTSVNGTGLGLAICKRIVERMGGSIRVESIPGAGALFEFTVPLAAAQDREPASTLHPDLTGQNVLIVTPVAIEAPLLARRLLRWGAKVVIVPDQSAAAAIVPERRWDTLIADHALGRAALHALAQTTAGHIKRRIVLITPAARAELPALKQDGFTSYLIKPVRPVSLAARMQAEDAGADMLKEMADEAPIVPSLDDLHASSLSILVAEDNEINALLARSLLTKLGHKPAVAVTGTDALEAYFAARSAGTPFDLILMDVRMPGIDGLEAARRIRAAETRAGQPRTPIIALTANAFPEHREACLAAGMDGFITKPLDRERLIRALDDVSKLPQSAA